MPREVWCDRLPISHRKGRSVIHANLFLVFMTVGALAGCSPGPQKAQAVESSQQVPTKMPKGLEKATFGGGCFWCMEPPFDAVEGVYSTISGYMGGHKDKPTYREVSSGTTGHTEVVQVHFDPAVVSYEKLVEVFWRNIDPLVENRQFCDAGSQYRSAIFFHSAEQENVVRASKEMLAKSGVLPGPIKTEVNRAGTFFPAEEYHQDFYLKEPSHYKRYRKGCGRDRRLKALWGNQPK